MRAFAQIFLTASAVFASTVGTASFAQKGLTSAPTVAVERARAQITAGQRHLMDRYHIDAAEAARRLALEERVSALAKQLASQYPDDFGGVWIQHEPVYQIVVGFKNAEARQNIRDQIDPELRRFVLIKNVRSSASDRDSISDQIASILTSSGIEYVSYYEHRTDDLVIEVGADITVGKVRSLLPANLQNSVRVIRGTIPKRLQASGYVSGDSIYAGWWWSSTQGGAFSCSFSFAAKDNQNRTGVLTAGHCPNTSAYIYYTSPSVHWVRLAPATINWNAPNTKYDYRFYLVTGLGTGAWVYFDNSSTKIYGWDINGASLASYSSQNVVSGYASSGYFAVVGTYGYYDQVVGDVLCKSGHGSGLTCGEVTHGWYTYNGVQGWIETGYSSQEYYSIGGDSGGAVFTSPNANGEVKAAGVVTAATLYDPTLNPDGTSNSSGDERYCAGRMEGNPAYNSNLNPSAPEISDCRMVHMPIDYIDDQQLLTVITQPAI